MVICTYCSDTNCDFVDPLPALHDEPDLIYSSDEEGAVSRLQVLEIASDAAGARVMAPASTRDMIDPKRVGPHPSYLEIAEPYIFQSTIQQALVAASVSEAKDDSIRLQGVAWIDSVRKAVQLPTRTYDTACLYYHKYRLKHLDSPGYIDAAAAALFAACKIEDTLKKSKEILCAAHNMKLSPAEQLTPDDSMFETHSKTIIGIERLMLEAARFDFRTRYPQELLIKVVKYFLGDQMEVSQIAHNISLDLYRTYAPLKQTAHTMVLACLELSGRLLGEPIDGVDDQSNYDTFKTSREEVMETLLDLLDLYTHYQNSSLVGPQHALETFISVRIALNQEASTKGCPRYRMSEREKRKLLAKGSKASKGTKGPTAKKDVTPPTSPQAESTKAITSPVSNGTSKPGLKDGTVRFMLDPQRAAEEKSTVGKFFEVEEEEYEVEVEVERKVADAREKRRP